MELGGNTRLGKYQLKFALGQGGMGIVYRATDLRLKRDVAVKVLMPEHSSDTKAVRRFLQEARAVARLSHPNVVAVHDVDLIDGWCFFVMELLSGGTAQDLVAHGPLPWEEATAIVMQACRGLAAAHEAGLIHRDVKPANLMLTTTGTIKVADFGLVKCDDPALAGTRSPLTEQSMVLGTPLYMSPEQCRGEELDARTDLYSLGVSYFVLLTGQTPFADGAAVQVMFAHCSAPVPDPRARHAEVPAGCAAVVQQALAKNRADRFASARDMLRALEGVLARSPTIAVGRLGGPGSGEDPDLTPTVSVAAASQDEKDCSVAQPPLALAAGSAPAARRRHAIVTAAAVLLLGLVSAASWWFGGGGRGPALPVQQLGEGIPTDRSITLMPAGALAEINAGVPCIAIAPDSKSLYGGALDGSVCQWDIASVGKGAAVAPAAAPLVRRFEGTKGIIRAVAVHERWVAAGGQAKTVWLWPAGSAKPKVALDDFNGDIRALAISRDGRRLAVGSYTEARLYELDEGGARLIKVLGSSAEGQVKCYMVLSVAFSPDSRWLAATSWRDRCVAVWDAEGGQLREVVRGQPDDPTAVTFLGGDQVLIGLFKAGVRLWNIKTAEMRPLAASKGSELRSMAVGGRNAIVVGEWGGTIRIYDRASEAPAQVIRAATSKSTLAVALAPDGRLAATCGGAEDERGGYIHLWQVTERTE